MIPYSLVCCLSVVEGVPKAPFSIATTPRCKGGHSFFPGIAPLSFDPYLIMLSVKQGDIKYHFWVFSVTPLNPGLANHYTKEKNRLRYYITQDLTSIKPKKLKLRISDFQIRFPLIWITATTQFPN